MTPQEQRIAIAELFQGQLRSEAHLTIYFEGSECFTHRLWLGLIHEAEKAAFFGKGVPASRWEAYDDELARICGGFARAHATAAQRAEALCRTLWPERWT